MNELTQRVLCFISVSSFRAHKLSYLIFFNYLPTILRNVYKPYEVIQDPFLLYHGNSVTKGTWLAELLNLRGNGLLSNTHKAPIFWRAERQRL